jgi:hypothetical protein
MARSTGDNTRKRRPKQAGTLIGVRLQAIHLSSLDEWTAALPDPKPTRPEAIRRLIELGLKAAKAEKP